MRILIELASICVPNKYVHNLQVVGNKINKKKTNLQGLPNQKTRFRHGQIKHFFTKQKKTKPMLFKKLKRHFTLSRSYCLR